MDSVKQTVDLVSLGREEAATSQSYVKEASHLFEQLFHAAANNRTSAKEIGMLSNQAFEQSESVNGEIKRLILEMENKE